MQVIYDGLESILDEPVPVWCGGVASFVFDVECPICEGVFKKGAVVRFGFVRFDWNLEQEQVSFSCFITGAIIVAYQYSIEVIVWSIDLGFVNCFQVWIIKRCFSGELLSDCSVEFVLSGLA